ncbi:hypothetical protein ACFE04_005228 [Oxalis oulophora]
MAHSLITPPTTTLTSISATRSKKGNHFPLPGSQQRVICAYNNESYSNHTSLEHKLILQRRTTTLGLASTMLGLAIGEGSAMAAARRGPPPPAVEKKDPNVSGVLAKVLASKKRKEAMKESMEKLREKGKPVKQPLAAKNEAPPPTPPPANVEEPPQ